MRADTEPFAAMNMKRAVISMTSPEVPTSRHSRANLFRRVSEPEESQKGRGGSNLQESEVQEI